MSPLQINDPKNAALASDAPAGRSAATPATVSTTQDRLWQQAMRQAQQSGFADWFAGPALKDEVPLASDNLPVAPHVVIHAHAFRWAQEGVNASPESALGNSASLVAVSGQDRSNAGYAAASAPSSQAKLEAFSNPAGSCALGRLTQGAAPNATVDRTADVSAALIRDFARVGVTVSVGAATDHEPVQAASNAPNANRRPALELAGEPPLELPHDDSAPAADDAEPSSAKRKGTAEQPTAAHESDPVRVHAEWSAAGVRVWLGAEANALGAAHELASQLQSWLATHGERLLGLICNGRALTLPRSTPSRSSATEVDADAPSPYIYPPTQEAP